MGFTSDNSGPGTWWVIHMLAESENPCFPTTMNAIEQNFYCKEVCKPHIVEYMKKNPIPRDPKLWYQFTIDFHNAVNKRLGKHIMSRSEVDAIFRPTEENDGECASCSVGGHGVSSKTTQIQNAQPKVYKNETDALIERMTRPKPRVQNKQNSQYSAEITNRGYKNYGMGNIFIG